MYRVIQHIKFSVQVTRLQSFRTYSRRSYVTFDLPKSNLSEYKRFNFQIVDRWSKVLFDIKTNLLETSSISLKMSDDENEGPKFPFCLDYDKRGKAKCKRCKQAFEKGKCKQVFSFILFFQIMPN